MRLKAIADHNRVVRLEDWNGLDLTGANDCASILNAAMTQGLAYGWPVIAPATPPSGGLLIGSTIEYKVPLFGAGYGYASSFRTNFVSGITNGTPVIDAINKSGWQIERITIQSSYLQNCIGLRAGRPGGLDVPEDVACTHGLLRDITIVGPLHGYQIQGWSNSSCNLLAASCGTGLYGTWLNACVFDFQFEGCQIPFIVEHSDGLKFTRIRDEDLGSVARTAPSRIDTSVTTSIDLYYSESGSPVSFPLISVGSQSSLSPCADFKIHDGFVGKTLPGTSPIALDYVNTFSIPATFRGDTLMRAYSTTANTRNDRSPAPYMTNGAPFTTIVSGLKHTALDLFPNPYMDGLRWGCKDAQLAGGNRVTVSVETTIVKTGSNALKITAVSGYANNYFALVYDDPWITSIKGQSLTVGAWVYVPPSLNMGSNESPATYVPRVGLASNGTGGTSAQSTTDRQSGGWTFMHAKLAAVPTDATEVTLSFYVNLTGTNATGAEYIIVDECHLAVGDCWEALFEGRIQRSPLAVGHVENGLLTIRKTTAQATTIIADTNQTHKTGDLIIYTDPLAGQVEGKKLTTTGWKDVGVIAL